MMPGFELSQTDREAKAKELMAAAGYGPDNPLKLSIVTTVAEDRTRLAQGVALMWKQVLGVEASVEPMELTISWAISPGRKPSSPICAPRPIPAITG
jgi:ABC-type oligopeptide transport system substrate-binding subunit